MSDGSFTRAVKEHQHRVFTLACYLLGDSGEAEDVTQEVLLRLWHHRQVLASERLVGWLSRVTRNACLDRLRTRRSRARFLSDQPSATVATVVAAPGRDPEQLSIAGQFSDRVASELEQLDEPYRSALVLREIQELSYREIAEILDLSLDQVKVTIHRGRRQLRHRLREVMPHAAAC